MKAPWRLVLLAPLPLAAAEPRPFTHPGVMHRMEDIEWVRAKVKAGGEPWASAWKEMGEHRHAALDWKPRAHPDVQRGPYNNPSIGANEFMSDSAAAYTHALRWAIGGEAAHAAKAIEILDNYSSTLRSVGHHDARLLIGMGGIHFVNAAELLVHLGADWAEASRERFAGMLRKVLYPVIEDFYPTANGNWDAAMIQTMLAMGVFLDDRAMFDRAADYFRHGKGNGCVTMYLKPSGQCQESGRDQSHTQMGLCYLACSAEIAWNQGVDLYGFADDRLAKGYEYTARYNLGHEVPFERHVSFKGRYDHTEISARGRGELRAIYAIPFRHYRSRLGMEMPFTGRALEKRGPEHGGATFMPWGTLMFSGERE